MTQPLRLRPRLLNGPLAAEYLGISHSTLRALSIPRKVRGANRLYDVRDLDAYADALPYDGQAEENTCDKAFED